MSDKVSADWVLEHMERLSPKSGDVFVVRYENSIEVREIKELLEVAGPQLAQRGILLLVLHKDKDISLLDEETMNKNGWYHVDDTTVKKVKRDSMYLCLVGIALLAVFFLIGRYLR